MITRTQLIDNETKKLFENELEAVIAAVASGFTGRSSAKREQAIALLSLLVGGVTLARAVNDAALSDEIANAVRKAAIRITT